MTGCASIDWADHWRSLVNGRDHQRGGRRDDNAQGDAWTERAARFATYSEHLPADDPLFLRLQSAARPTDTLLDIGAGAGRYALPLARLVRRVVAVEPSPSMLRQLAARIEAERAENVEVVAAAWPDAAVEPADLTLCAHVVYGVPEIIPFLRRLDASTRRTALIAIRVDQHPGVADLARALFGQARVPQPAFLDLYNALASLDIVADVQIVPVGGFRFDDHAAARAHFRDRLRVPADGELDARLAAILAERLVQEPDGRWRWPGTPPRTAIVSWTK